MKPCKRWAIRRNGIVEGTRKQSETVTPQSMKQAYDIREESQVKEAATRCKEDAESSTTEAHGSDGMADKIKVMRNMFSKEIGEFVENARRNGYFPDKETRDGNGDMAHTPIGQKIAKRIVEEMMADTDKITREMFRTIIQMPTDEGAWMVNNIAMIAKISTRKALTNLWLCDTGCGHDLVGLKSVQRQIASFYKAGKIKFETAAGITQSETKVE